MHAAIASGVLLKMEVGIRKGAWQRDWRYPAYLWSLRWVYAVKKPPEVGIRRIPAYTPQYTTGYCIASTTSPKWAILCRVGRKTLLSSVQFYQCCVISVQEAVIIFYPYSCHLSISHYTLTLWSNPLKWIAVGPDYEYPLRQSVQLSMFYTLHCVWNLNGTRLMISI